MNTPKKNIFRLITVFLALFSLSGCRGASARPETLTSFALDTVVSVTYYRASDKEAAENALALVNSYEKIFSRTDENAELFLLNRQMHESEAADGSVFRARISPELCDILSACRKYAEISPDTKAFDCTLGALSASYNFSGDTHRVPSQDETRELLSHCGMDKWTLEAPDVFVSSDSALTLDLGAIAKGYIADRMKESMVSDGVRSAIINLGGNILLIGSKPDGSDYEIGIADPENPASPITTLKLSDCAMVTSGTYQRSFVSDGKEYHHILDPATGYPADNGLYSVTVIAENSTDADALSTALFVLGEEKGEALGQCFSLEKTVYIDKDRNIR